MAGDPSHTPDASAPADVGLHPLLRGGLRHAETSLVALDTDGRIIAIDEVGAGWLGARPEAVIGNGPWVFGGLIREDEWPATWERLSAERHLLVEGSIVGRGGALFRLALQLSYVPPGGERGPYVMVVAMRRAVIEPDTSTTDGLTRLHYASAFIDDPLIDCNVVTGELTLNEAAARLLGIAPGTVLSLSQLKERMAPDQRASIESTMRRLVEGTIDSAQYVRRLERPGAPPRQILVRMRIAARSPDGRVLRLVGHGVDITDREQAAAEARVQQEMFAAVAHTSTAAIVVLDARGRIVFANTRAEEVLGLSRSTLVERTYDDPEWRSTAPDGGPWPDDAQPFVRVMATRAPVTGVRHAIEWPNGLRRQLLINGEPLFDAEGEINRVVFTVEDVTAQVAAAERLARSEQRLRDVLDRLSVGVNLSDGEGRLRFWNRASQAVLGLDEDDTGAQLFLRAWDTVDGSGAPFPRSELPLLRALSTRQAVHGVEMGFRRRGDEERRWFLVSSIPRLDERGRVADVLTQFVDISDSRRLEARLRDARRHEAVGRLAGGVAHDFNNLLTTVLANVEYMMTVLPANHPLRLELSEIQRAGERGASLVRALLGYARRQFRMPRPFDATRLVRWVAARWQRRVAGAIDLSLVFDDEVPELTADPDQFEQVLEALLDNAHDATGERGRVQVELSVTRVEEDDRRWPGAGAGDYLCLAVSDDGPGVDPKALHRIFDPFFTTRGPGQHTGLGLANCQGIARQNGGDIRVAETGPDGATFEVVCPLKRLPADGGAASSDDRI